MGRLVRTPGPTAFRLLPLTVACLLLGERDAHACKCGRGIDVLYPKDGAADVRDDTAIWVGSRYLADEPGSDQKEIVLRDGQGAVFGGMPGRLQMGRQGFVQILKPQVPLASGRAYEVTAGQAVVSRFRVTDTQARSVPPLTPPRLESQTDSGSFGSSCGTEVGVHLSFLAQNAVLLIGETVGDTHLDPIKLSGDVSALDSGSSLYYGMNGCIENLVRPAPWDFSMVRFGAFDAAGRFSGWSEPVVLRLSWGAWFQAHAPSIVGVVSLGLFVAFFFFRYRRGRRPASQDLGA